MHPINVLVISNPSAPYLHILDGISEQARISIAHDFESAQGAALEAEVILLASFRREPFRSIFPLARRLEWVHAVAAGVDGFLFPEFVSSSVPLTNGRGMFSDALAEFAIAAMLFFSKDLRRMLRNQEAGRWERFDVERVSGATVGIVGYGAIGQASAKLARGMGMRVLAVRKRAALSENDAFLEAIYPSDRLGEMLGLSDFLLVSAPLTPETRGMLGEAELSALKSSAVVINVGRGAVIVESALIDALENHRIRGAALDVFEQEPLPAGHPFYRMQNVLLSPHCADEVPGWQEPAMHAFVDNFERYRNGQPLRNVVDKTAGY